MTKSDDRQFMLRAIDLAKAGEGWVHPNPMVGAVIVKDGRVIGEGYHEKWGQLHAERNAIASLKEAADGATIYVTLEPCCHYGKTPPCTEAIIESGISRVVIGSRDPNPLVAGKGAKILREAGVTVEEDFMRRECDALNPVFFHYITTKRPYVIMKYAMTADGKIATKTGASKWITGEEARGEVQRIRHACMGICVGIGTVLADDPMLNCRLENGRDPVRIICDSSLRIPAESNICRTAGTQETIVVCADPSMPVGEPGREHPAGFDLREHGSQMSVRIRRLQQMGVTVLNVPEIPKHEDADKGSAQGVRGSSEGISSQVDMRKLMEILGARGIDSVLLEGGGALNDSALRAGIVNEIRAFIAPKIFGGSAKSPVEGSGIELPDQAIGMELLEMKQFGRDLMLRYQVLPDEGR